MNRNLGFHCVVDYTADYIDDYTASDTVEFAESIAGSIVGAVDEVVGSVAERVFIVGEAVKVAFAGTGWRNLQYCWVSDGCRIRDVMVLVNMLDGRVSI